MKLLTPCCCSGCDCIQVIAAQAFFGWPQIPPKAQGSGSWETGNDDTDFINWLTWVEHTNWALKFGIIPTVLNYIAMDTCPPVVPRRSTLGIWRHDGWFVADYGDGEQAYANWHYIELWLDEDDGFLKKLYYQNSCGESYTWELDTSDGSEIESGDLITLAHAGLLYSTCGGMNANPSSASANYADWHATYGNAEIVWGETITVAGSPVDKEFRWEYRWTGGTGDVGLGLGWGYSDARQTAIDNLAVINLSTMTSSVEIDRVGGGYGLVKDCIYKVGSSTSYDFKDIDPWPKRSFCTETLFEETAISFGWFPTELFYGITYGNFFYPAGVGWVAFKFRAGIQGTHYQQEWSQTSITEPNSIDDGECAEWSYPTTTLCEVNPFSGGLQMLGPDDLASTNGIGRIVRDTVSDINAITSPNRPLPCITVESENPCT